MPATTTTRKRKKLKEIVISEIPMLKALADSTRLQVLIELGDEARTVKDVASMLGVRPTRLYYHFKILEQAGLIRVAEKRMVSGIEERSYETVAESTTVAPEALASGAKSGVIGALLSAVRAELELALLTESTSVGDPTGPVPLLSMVALRLSPNDVKELQNRYLSLMEDFGDPDDTEPGKQRYHGLFVAYLAPSEVRSLAS